MIPFFSKGSGNGEITEKSCFLSRFIQRSLFIHHFSLFVHFFPALNDKCFSSKGYHYIFTLPKNDHRQSSLFNLSPKSVFEA